MKMYKGMFLGMLVLSGLIFSGLYIKNNGAQAQSKLSGPVSQRDTKSSIFSSLDKQEFFNAKGFSGGDEVQVIPYTGPAIKPPRSAKGLEVTHAPEALLTQSFEVEPNGTPATATPIPSNTKVKASNIFPNGDIDYFSFQANAGDRVSAFTMTSYSAGNSSDSQLTLFASDGTTVIEFDDDNGSFAALSSSIAGAIVPATGTYYLRVNDYTAGTGSQKPYDLYVQTQSGTPTPEIEGNDTPATANPLPASGWVSGARNPAVATEQDWYSIALNAGDTLVLSLDLDPERDGITWNGRLGAALFGDANNQILVVDDAGAAETPTTIPSEAMVITVRTAGTYYAFVDSATASTGGPTATYHLSAQVFPRIPDGVNCTTYTSTNVPMAIGPANSLTSSTLTVPGNPRIQSIRPFFTMNHAVFQDIDVHLRSPAGNDNGIFTDIGSAAPGGQQQMETVFDQDAGLPPSFTVLRNTVLKPENTYRLDWFHGENAGGTWTLDVYDDTAGANGGTLTSWGLEICEQPPVPGTLIYSEDFESGAGGYTHSGTQDEWELGLPATVATNTANPIAAFNSCNSGVNCWKTDLDNTYELNSSQSLVSRPLNLSQYPGPLTLSWAMRYQMESASFDNARVSMRQVGNPASERILWQFTGATMTDAPGNPATQIGASAGWGTYHANISSFAGQVVEVIFHLNSDSSVNFGGLAIDDVQIRHVGPTAANVPVAGRVLSSGGMPMSRALVTLTDDQGVVRTTYTTPFGYYSFEDVAAGRTYTISAQRKGYTFNPVVVTVGDEITGLDITALP